MEVLSVFCLSVLAAFGVQKLLSRLPLRGKAVAVVLVPALLCVEQLSVPIPTVTVPMKDQIPAVYRWLAEQDDEFAIAEYPFGAREDRLRVYYSIYHSKFLVNGRSGFESPVYLELEARSEAFPWEQIVRDNEALAVRYLLIHRKGLGARGRTATIEFKRLQEGVLRDRLRLVEDFGDVVVYELPGRERRSRESFWEWHEPTGERLDRSGWQLTAEPFQNFRRRAVDDDLSTRWHSSRQVPGDFFEVDLGHVTEFDAIVMDLGRHGQHYPRGYRLEVSMNRHEWTTIREEPTFLPPITDYLRPFPIRVEIEVPGSVALYLRIVQTAEDPEHVWSIAELNLVRR